MRSFAGDELDVVYQQDVHGVEAVAEAGHAVEAKRVNYFNGKLFSAYVAQAHRRITFFDGVPDGMHQVGLAHAHSAIEKQRVVGFGRLLGHRARRGVRKLVGLAHDERIEAVSQIQLVITAFEIEFRLLHAGCSGSGWHGFFLRTHVLHFHVGSTKFVKDGLDDLAVGPRQDLPEDRAGDLHKQVFAIGAIQPRGLKPSRIRVDADPGLHVFEKSVPGIRRSSHRKRKTHPVISTDVDMLWKAGPFIIVFRLRESCPYRSVVLSPGAPCAALLDLPAPRTTSIRQRGIVADWNEWSKRKVCEGKHCGAHLIHSFSTSTILVQRAERTSFFAEFLT